MFTVQKNQNAYIFRSCHLLSIIPSANMFFCGDFNISGVHHKDWLTYSGGTDRSGEFCYIFSSQMILLR